MRRQSSSDTCANAKYRFKIIIIEVPTDIEDILTNFINGQDILLEHEIKTNE